MNRTTLRKCFNIDKDVTCFPKSYRNTSINLSNPKLKGNREINLYITHRIHVWYIYLHLAKIYGKCRQICHTWILWVNKHHNIINTSSKTLDVLGLITLFGSTCRHHFLGWNLTQKISKMQPPHDHAQRCSQRVLHQERTWKVTPLWLINQPPPLTYPPQK